MSERTCGPVVNLPLNGHALSPTTSESRSTTSHFEANGAPGNAVQPSTRARSSMPFIIGVAGGTASGKTTVCDMIMQRLNDACVVMLPQDSFYKSLEKEQLASVSTYNFDHPDAFDTEAILQCLSDLKHGRAVNVPVYDFTTHRRSDSESRRVEAADVVIIEGILVLHIEAIRAQLNMKIYVDTDDDVRLARRIQRDVSHRGRDVQGVLQQYTTFVKPSFDQFVGPSRRYADVIIPWQQGSNIVAIDLITEHIRSKLQQHDLRRIYHNLEVIPSNYQVKGMHTIIRDRDTGKNDFVFYADRLNRLVVEAGLGHLPFKERTVTTPTGHQYVGVEFARKLCGVSIIRSGESMENALRDCCKGIKIGKILVHRQHHGGSSTSGGGGGGGSCSNGNGNGAAASTSGSGTPPGPAGAAAAAAVGVCGDDGGCDIVYEKLPSDIASRHVMLMDPILSTGRTACKAIQVLLGKGVQEDKILLLTIIAAPEGVRRVCGTFRSVKVITSEIDDHVNADFQVVPGIGEFGDRYYS